MSTLGFGVPGLLGLAGAGLGFAPPAVANQQTAGSFVAGDVFLSAVPLGQNGDFKGGGESLGTLNEFSLCDGSFVGISNSFGALFNAQGKAFGYNASGAPFGGGPGFNVPDFQGRFPLGAGHGTGLTARAMGVKVGVEENAIEATSIPAIVITISDPGHTHTAVNGAAFLTNQAGTTWDSGSTWTQGIGSSRSTTGITMTTAAPTTLQPCVQPAMVVNFGVVKYNVPYKVIIQAGFGTVADQTAAAAPWQIGDIKMTTSPKPQTGWLECDGTQFAIADYAALSAEISNSYGGDGVTKFAVPDLRGSVPLGQGDGPGLSNRILGQSVGAEATAIAASSVPAVPMIVSDPGHFHGGPSSSMFVITGTGSSAVIGTAGGTSATTALTTTGITASTPAATTNQPNIGPCSVVRFLIRYA